MAEDSRKIKHPRLIGVVVNRLKLLLFTKHSLRFEILDDASFFLRIGNVQTKLDFADLVGIEQVNVVSWNERSAVNSLVQLFSELFVDTLVSA